MQQLTGFTEGVFPVRYLGTLLVFDKIKTCHFNPLIERIANFLNSWATHTPTYDGKLELIKFVIQGVESFWIQNFPIPATIIDNISKLCRNFLWSGSKPKVAWAGICTPKNEGGWV